MNPRKMIHVYLMPSSNPVFPYRYIYFSLNTLDKKEGIPGHAFMQEIRSLNLEPERAKMSARSLMSGDKNEIQKKEGKRT